MLIGGASMAIASMWASMTTWSTPTVFFCILNLMIATIFIASNFKSHNHNHHPHPHTPQRQLGRPPSFLERVKSVNLSSFYYNTDLSHPHDDELRVDEYDPIQYNSLSQLNRVPSLLQRVKSFKLASVLNSDDHLSSFQYNTDLSHDDEHKVDHNESTRYHSPSQLNRVPSFLQRVKSFKLASVLNSDHQDPVSDMSEDSGVTPAKKSSANLAKSSSEKRAMPELDDQKENVDRRRPATMRASVVVHDESVDEKADDFIRRFKQQLKLQRIDSLKRFREMMNRGTSSG